MRGSVAMWFSNPVSCKQEKDLVYLVGELFPQELLRDFFAPPKQSGQTDFPRASGSPAYTCSAGPAEGANTTRQPALAHLALQAEEAAACGSISIFNHPLALQVAQFLLAPSISCFLPNEQAAECSQQYFMPAVTSKKQTPLSLALLCSGGHFLKEEGAVLTGWVSSRREEAHLQMAQS